MELFNIIKEKYRLLYLKTLDEANEKVPKNSALRILDIVVDEMIDKAVKENLEGKPNFDKNGIRKIKRELRSEIRKYKEELLKMH